MSNIITPVFNGQRGVTNAVYQYDYGMILDLSGIADLPDTFEVQFCNRCGQRTLPQVASGSSVAVPDVYLTTGLGVEAYVFIHTGADDGETVYQISIPVIRRPVPAEGTPTPVQQSAITEAIAALNAGVAAAEQSAEAAAEAAAQMPLAIHVTVDRSGNFSADKTYAEILAAMEAGRPLIAILEDLTVSPSVARFSASGTYSSRADGAIGWFLNTENELIVDSDGEWDVFINVGG